jgi:hypothetical protein
VLPSPAPSHTRSTTITSVTSYAASLPIALRQTLKSGTELAVYLALISQSQSYVTTDGQSASLSWCQVPTWGLRQDFYYSQTAANWLMWGALSDERTGLLFTIAAGPSQSSHSWVRVQLTLSDLRLPQPGGPGPPIYIPRNSVAQLHPQALGSLSVASYDRQGYGGGIRTRHHAEVTT